MKLNWTLNLVSCRDSSVPNNLRIFIPCKGWGGWGVGGWGCLFSHLSCYAMIGITHWFLRFCFLIHHSLLGLQSLDSTDLMSWRFKRHILSFAPAKTIKGKNVTSKFFFLDNVSATRTIRLILLSIEFFHKLDEIGNNANIGIRGFTT